MRKPGWKAPRALRYLSLAALLAASTYLAACGDEKKSGEFKLNPGDFSCRGYLKTSIGDAYLLPGDFYWYGASSTGCVQGNV